LNGAKVLGWIIRVDHVSKYKKKRKRKMRKSCRRREKTTECNRGASRRYSHDEQVSVLCCVGIDKAVLRVFTTKCSLGKPVPIVCFSKTVYRLLDQFAARK
jgi:hypothetical protein